MHQMPPGVVVYLFSYVRSVFFVGVAAELFCALTVFRTLRERSSTVPNVTASGLAEVGITHGSTWISDGTNDGNEAHRGALRDVLRRPEDPRADGEYYKRFKESYRRPSSGPARSVDHHVWMPPISACKAGDCLCVYRAYCTGLCTRCTDSTGKRCQIVELGSCHGLADSYVSSGRHARINPLLNQATITVPRDVDYGFRPSYLQAFKHEGGDTHPATKVTRSVTQEHTTMHLCFNNGPEEELLFHLPLFQDLINAEVSGLLILTAPEGGLVHGAEEVPVARKHEDMTEITELRHRFNPQFVNDEHPGFVASPVRVGDIMPWGDFIEGAGRWYHVYEGLMRQSQDFKSMDIMISEVRAALLDAFTDAGLDAGPEGDFIHLHRPFTYNDDERGEGRREWSEDDEEDAPGEPMNQ